MSTVGRQECSSRNEHASGAYLTCHCLQASYIWMHQPLQFGLGVLADPDRGHQTRRAHPGQCNPPTTSLHHVPNVSRAVAGTITAPCRIPNAPEVHPHPVTVTRRSTASRVHTQTTSQRARASAPFSSSFFWFLLSFWCGVYPLLTNRSECVSQGVSGTGKFIFEFRVANVATRQNIAWRTAR